MLELDSRAAQDCDHRLNKLEDIQLRKARLAVLAQSQRVRLASQLQSLQPLIAVADRGAAALQTVRTHPALFAAALGLLIALRPGRAVKWLRRGLLAWRTWRWAQDKLVAFMQSK